MAFTAITTAQVAVDAPYTSELGTTIKEDLDFLNASVAAPTDVSNGGFEIDSDADGVPDNWTVDYYTGGSSAFNTTTPYEGAQSFQFTHPGGAGNGGGYVESGYLTISEYISPLVQFALKNSAAGTKVVCRLRYFDKDKNDLSSDEDIYSSVANPTTWTLKTLWGIPPATARYMKIRLIGGLDDTDVAGDVYFDVVHYDPFPKVLYDNFTIAEGSTSAHDTTERDIANTAIKIPKGFSLALIPVEARNSGPSQFTVRYRITATYSDLRYDDGWGYYTIYYMILNISALSGAQTLYTQATAPANTTYVKKAISLATYVRQ